MKLEKPRVNRVDWGGGRKVLVTEVGSISLAVVVQPYDQQKVLALAGPIVNRYNLYNIICRCAAYKMTVVLKCTSNVDFTC